MEYYFLMVADTPKAVQVSVVNSNGVTDDPRFYDFMIYKILLL